MTPEEMFDELSARIERVRRDVDGDLLSLRNDIRDLERQVGNAEDDARSALRAAEDLRREGGFR